MNNTSDEKQEDKTLNSYSLNLQIKYKHDFEKLLGSVYEFSLIDKKIMESSVEISKINKNSNFYLETSNLPSQYIYLRNNVYIERLTTEEFMYLEECFNKKQALKNEFLIQTFKKVLFETESFVMLGTPRLENVINGKSLIFEFGYDQRKFIDFNQLKFIKTLISNLRGQLEHTFKEKLDCEVTLREYNCISDLYVSEENNLKK